MTVVHGESLTPTCGETYCAICARKRAVRVKRERPDYDRDAYSRGWRSSLSGGEGMLDRADGRREPTEWYDGYFDAANGWLGRWHSALCEGEGVGECDGGH